MMIGIGMPSIQSKIPRPIAISLSWCSRNVQSAFAFQFRDVRDNYYAHGFIAKVRPAIRIDPARAPFLGHRCLIRLGA